MTNEQQPALDLDSASTQSLLDVLSSLASEFERLLRAETVLMDARNMDDLPTIAEHKQTVVSELMHQEHVLEVLFTDHVADERVQALKQKLEICREVNQKNQTIATIELDHTRSSLELLRSLLRMDDLPLYGASGQIRIAREKRHLGDA